MYTIDMAYGIDKRPEGRQPCTWMGLTVFETVEVLLPPGELFCMRALVLPEAGKDSYLASSLRVSMLTHEWSFLLSENQTDLKSAGCHFHGE